MASSEIKDKRILMDNRKLIETQMERFKVVERETKTKAYSKEGLGGAQKVDPAQKEKEDITNWLSNSIAILNIHVDQFESEVESLMIGVKKKKNDNQDRLEELKLLLERHRYHIVQLETLMRMLDNGTVEVYKIRKIKEDIEYYIESCQDPDFEENEFLYDDLDLRDMAPLDYLSKGAELLPAENCLLPPGGGSGDGSATGLPAEECGSSAQSDTPASTNSSSPVPSPGLTNHSRPCESGQAGKPVTVRSHVPNSSGNAATQNSRGPAPITSRNNSSNSSPSVNSHQNHAVASPPSTPYAVAAAANTKADMSCLVDGGLMMPCSGTPSPPPSSGMQSCIGMQDQYHRTLSSSPVQHNNNNSSSSSSTTSTSSSCLSGGSQLLHSGSNNSGADLGNSGMGSLYGLVGSQQGGTGRPSSPTAPSPHLMNGPLQDKLRWQQPQECLIVSADGASGPLCHGDAALRNLRRVVRGSLPAHGAPQGPVSSPALGHAPVTGRLRPLGGGGHPAVVRGAHGGGAHPSPPGRGPAGARPPSKECFYHLHLLEAAALHMPHPSDSERLRPYLPRNPSLVPNFYPQSLPHCDTVDFFQKLSTETLFFVFYYMEGSKAQYLAAKALKKQSWRFHTKYMMWFQRHEEPKTITDEYEQGTYIYFDYEKWSQRRKEGFTFEYRYLEDRDLN
ncbi:conserved hypothetical protein [Ixodes scapularis]|uniref:CCR4-NOT transcription complex subunit 3 n=1 Tax=Ixodes scapularis TaxID=6945 RepID=B7PMA1_IXOSC|nr:conserved hypothetical protein [Ixodes scapularis]|eukprot:XP_002434899.1 conserved hypothetical protein [Ixodes scapularis]